MQDNNDLQNAVKLSGTVEKITYKNQQNGYTVAVVKTQSQEETVVGILPFLNEGETADFYGEYIVHPTYGQQFRAATFERRVPRNAASVLKYLSSGVIKGIGPATAGKIVEKFGEDSLDIIQNHPLELATLKGISKEKAIEVSKEYQKQYGVRDIMVMLAKYHVTPDSCVNIYRRYGAKSTDIIKENPYCLCEEGIDFDFEIAEDIARDLKFEPDNELRICAGLEYVLRRNLTNGHTCLPRDKFIKVSCRLLGCKDSVAEICCDRLMECFRMRAKIMNGTEYISLPEYYSAEEYIAARLMAVNKYINTRFTVDALEIDNVENRIGIKFQELQRAAIMQAYESGILILTGGPGTGKTTTLNAIISLFERFDLSIELAAPTGRAAKRMTELTGREAKTIHRLLEVEWGENGKLRFTRNEKNPLDCEVIIIDEASMIDALLFESVLKALRLSCRIILVGDSDQLPSIGAGNILNDILNSEAFPAIRLQKVFRQASKSLIVTNAHAIIENRPADFSKKDSDCFMLRRYDKYEVVETVAELCCERLKAAYSLDPLKDIQVLCPSRMYETGTVNFNNILQSRLNPLKKGEPQLSYKGIYFRIGDKVMQIKNNYDLQYKKDNGEYGSGVFNGDVGFITDIDIRAGIVKVRYDDRVTTYFPEDLGQLELAYAVTVHKSQGSEYDCVVLPLFDVPDKLKYRNLLYTAVTRAKKLLIVVGSEAVWNCMAENNRKTLRYTMLKSFLEDNQTYGTS